MAGFETVTLPEEMDELAPDGSEVRILLRVPGASLAHFRLAAGATAVAMRHRTVTEVWFGLAGRGEVWRRLGDDEAVVVMEAGVCLTIPVGTEFQFRAGADGPLDILGVTLPPWPGAGEAVDTDGAWAPTLGRGPG
jgi:mannose-6-phosphate isomerase-like protein (cupin superfamily)